MIRGSSNITDYMLSKLFLIFSYKMMMSERCIQITTGTITAGNKTKGK